MCVCEQAQRADELQRERDHLAVVGGELETLVGQLQVLVREREEEAQVLKGSKQSLQDQLDELRQDVMVPRLNSSEWLAIGFS